MRDHVGMRAEDYDDIDESTIEVHEGHPVKVIFSIELEDGDHELLCDIGKREGKTSIDVAREAIHAYAVAHSRSRRLAS
jgi:precorrin-6B methylase 2